MPVNVNSELPKEVRDKLIEDFSFIITKATYDPKTRLTRFSATASDTDRDLLDQRMSLDLFKEFIKKASFDEPAPVEFQSSYWKGGMPYVSVSHYPDFDGEAVPGEVTSLYIDGNRFKAKGFLYDNPLGIACSKAIKQSLADGTDDKVRISIAFLDWKHSHGNMVFERKSLSDICPACKDGVGDKTFLSGQLIHLAFTRVPVNRRTDVEVDLSMTIKTQTADAESIVGKELAEDLEAKKKSLVSQSEAVVIRSDTVETPPAEEVPAPVEEEAMFADPKNKKYPIDDEKHIRAAWSYIHMPRNQKGYTPEEVKAIEGKIVSAWKKVIDKAGPAEAKKGMLLMSTVVENMDMGSSDPMMYLPYDGAVTFQQADDYKTAQDAMNEFYDDWYMFNSLAGNIMSCGDVTDKMGAMTALVGEFKNRLDQSTKEAVQEMSLAIKELRKPVAPPHPLDDTVSVLKAQFTEVSSNPTLDRNGKLELIQQSFVQVGEAIKGAIPESEVQPVVEAPVVPGALDVETLRSAFAEAMAPLMQTLQIQNEKISQLQQQSSAVVGTNLTRQVIPTRRSIDPALVRQSTTQVQPVKPGSLKDIIRKSVFGADAQSG